MLRHLVTHAETPSASRRLSVCYAAICYPGGARLGHDELCGLPLANGTHVVSEVTCPECRAFAATQPKCCRCRDRIPTGDTDVCGFAVCSYCLVFAPADDRALDAETTVSS